MPSRLTMLPRALVLALALGTGGCSDASGPSSPACDDAALRHCILFIGNSLTYVNDLPAVTAALAVAVDEGPIRVASVAYPDYGLEQHWELGDAQRAIASAAWTTVVLQQGPSALPASRVNLRDYVARYDALIRAAGAGTALYMPWPALENFDNFAASSESYRLAADDVDATLFAVGDAWRAAWAIDPAIPLYSADGLHPTPTATYLAALVIVGKLSGRSTVGFPARLTDDSGVLADVPAAIAAVLQQAADEVNGVAAPARRRAAPRRP